MKGFEPLYPPHCSPQIRSASPTSADFSGSTAASQAKSCDRKGKKKKDRRQTGIYTRKRGSEQRDKEAHLDDFLVCASGREESGDAVAERRGGLVNSNHSPTFGVYGPGWSRSRTH